MKFPYSTSPRVGGVGLLVVQTPMLSSVTLLGFVFCHASLCCCAGPFHFVSLSISIDFGFNSVIYCID